ncbi:MAG: type II toxin-antitoxin system RelE/ParE family toxin [Pseudomonadota bacterium]
MKCVFTERAESDLEIIADYIAIDNAVRAVSFVREIRQRCHKITDAPFAYPLAPEYGDDIRKIPFGNYLILYTIDQNDVVILHITHSARRQPYYN